MSDLKPLWMARTFVKRRPKRRQGIKLIEWTKDQERCVAKWGPYSDQKRVSEAMRKAQAMRQKLMQVWPCTFLVKGYDYRPPAHLPDPSSSSEGSSDDQ